MKHKKGKISQLLGVASPGPLTKSECMRKVKILRTGLEKGRYTGWLRDYAVYYANWYKWRAVNKRKAA